MEIDKFFVSILFVILPGLIAVKIFYCLIGDKSKKDWHEFSDIFLFSIISYGLYGICVFMAGKGTQYNGLTLFNLMLNKKTEIYWPEIVWTSFIAVPVAIIATYAYTYKWINKFGQKIRSTNKYGDEDVWEFFHNTGKIEWVFIRDHKLNLTYKCWIDNYSDSEKDRELIIRDVSVYSNITSDYLYDTPIMYIAREKDDLSIEVIPKEEKGEKNGS